MQLAIATSKIVRLTFQKATYTLPHLTITLTIFYRENQSFDITDDVPRARVEALTRAWIWKEAS